MKSRYLVVIVAVLMVALGIAIGAGPLQHGASDQERALMHARAVIAERGRTITALTGANRIAADYASTTASRVVSGVLTGRKVALVSLPGAAPGTVELLRGLIGAAGAEVTAQVAIGPALFDPSNAGIVDALTSQMLAQAQGLTVPVDATGYQRFGALLYRAIGVAPAAKAVGGVYDASAISVVAGLKAANLITTAAITQRAGLTVFVLPGTAVAGSGRAAELAVLSTYTGYVPTVVAAPSRGALPGGLLAAMRPLTPATSSSVDSLETSTGQVSVILALAALTRGISGSYGAIGASNSAVPPVP
jgi:hypothetical protein